MGKMPFFFQMVPLGKLSFGKMYIWEVAAWKIAHFESCYLGNCHLGSCPWENAFGKVPNTLQSPSMYVMNYVTMLVISDLSIFVYLSYHISC